MSNLDVNIEKLKVKRKYALAKSKLAHTASVGFYSLGLAAVVLLTRKYNVEPNPDTFQYLKETLSASCACGIMGAATKYLHHSYEREVDTYDFEIATIEEQKKLVK